MISREIYWKIFTSEQCAQILDHKLRSFNFLKNVTEMFANTLVFISLGDFLYIPTLNTGQLNPLFHTFAEFRLMNRIVARQSTDWLAADAQFSPNGLLFVVFFNKSQKELTVVCTNHITIILRFPLRNQPQRLNFVLLFGVTFFTK